MSNRRNTSISSLVYSTLGPGLSLLTQEDKSDEDWSVIETGGAPAERKHTEGDAEGSGLNSGPGETSRPLRSSTASAGDIHCDIVESRQNDAEEDTASILSRLYSDSIQKQKPRKRLGFNSKSGAGSVSSSEHAILSKQDSSEDVFYPVVSKQLKEQMSKASIHEETERETSSSDVAEPVGLRKSSSNSGLGFIPRAPTGSEWGRSAGGSRDTVGLQEILKDLDREAGERKHRERVSSLQNDSMIGRGVAWEEDSISNRHIWQLVDSREACHLAESQYCQQLKVFHPRRQKVRCSACRVLVHDMCIKQLYYQGHCCRDSFREIKQKVKETVTYHHFLHRRRANGKCRKCDRGFDNWKLNTGRDIVGISCSWCGDSYHVACFNEGLKKDLCHLGPLRNLIIPPSWIVKVPAIEQFSSGASYSGSSEAHISPKGSARRKTRRSRRKKIEEKASRFFTVKPIAQRQHKPLLVFINPKSGGNQGAKLMQTFQWLLNPRQVFDLSQGGPEFGLKLYQGLSNFRVLACGGDGTAGWIFSIIDKLDIRPPPPLAILPLGTGNDLARVFNWGSGYADEPIDKILLHVEEGPVEEMDRWMLNVWENPKATVEADDGVDDTPLHVINNYFSIGCDAQISLQFHLEREANPERFNKRYKNKLQYGMLGLNDIFLRRFQTLTDHIQLYGDGEDLTERIRTLRLESICFLNISSYGAGADAWGTPSSRDPVFKPQVMSDGKIEIVGFWASTLPKLKVGLARGERIAQCEHIKLVTDRSFPVQIDGEACKLKPSVIEVGLKNKALLVRKVPRSRPEAPLQGVRDSIKLSVSKVTTEQYDVLNCEPHDLRKAAKAVGLVIATAQDNLSAVRRQIEQINRETDEDGEPRLAKEWRFLDMANSGRVDQMFQVTPDQEHNLVIGDMLSDGLLVVELPPSSAVSTPMSQAGLLMATSVPEEDEGSSDSPGFSDGAAARRKSYGRNASYEQATRFSPGPSASNSKNEVAVTGSSLSASGADSSPSDTPAVSDDDVVSPLAPFMKDTGSDSAGGSDDAAISAIQKGLIDAVKRGNVEKVRQYHKKGAKLTPADSAGLTPLHYAARLNKIGVVEYIIKNIPKEALDIVDEEKLQTALHRAAWYGYVDICKILVDSGASLNRLDYQNNNVLDKAVQSGIKELQEYFEGKMKASKAITSENELAI